MSENQYEKTAIMFADVEGSTSLYEKLGDKEAQKSIEQCLEHMANITTQHGGTVIKTIGDEIMCRFDTEDDAVAAACDIQEAIEGLVFSSHSALAIRIGLHYGLTIQKDGDVFGDAVNVAARMANIAKGKQIITTEETIINLEPHQQKKARKFDKTTVKGKQEEIVIYEVLWKPENATVIQNSSALAAIVAANKLVISWQGQQYEMSNSSPDLVLGRDERCTIKVVTNFASRVHAKIEYRRGKFVLIDQSTNGTHVKTDTNEDIYIRREELPLIGDGIICLGESIKDDNPNLIKYHCG